MIFSFFTTFFCSKSIGSKILVIDEECFDRSLPSLSVAELFKRYQDIIKVLPTVPKVSVGRTISLTTMRASI